jgi:DNA-3-methyladenine glycosylase
MKLGREFFAQPAVEVASALIGTVMVRRAAGVWRRVRIVETEAYLGPRDLASHASKGLTRRTEVLFGPPGRAYVYFVYGMHWMFNVVCSKEGDGQAVLVRAAEPLDGWTADLTGPAKLARALEITGLDNGCDLTGRAMYFTADVDHRPRIVRSRRIGIDYARHWKNRRLRFIDAASPVSMRLPGVKRSRARLKERE